MMLEELQRRNYSDITTRKYLQVVTAFARHFGKSRDELGPNELRSYQAYLLKERKVTPGTAVKCAAAESDAAESLRAYWCWRKPRTYLFPSRDPRRGPEQPSSDKSVWIAGSEAARHAGISNRVTPDTLSHSWATPLLEGGTALRT